MQLMAQEEPLKFMGRAVTIATPETDEDGFFPKGPASICIEGTPRQCHTMPDDVGRTPTAEVIEVAKGEPALLFSANTGGVSGWATQIVLLRPGPWKDLEHLLDVSLSNQHQVEFWSDSGISDAKILVTADYQWGPDEAHYDDHRYIISAYLFLKSSLGGYGSYYLEDRFMTLRKYDLDAGDDVLTSEKQEIIGRLLRVKQINPALR